MRKIAWILLPIMLALGWWGWTAWQQARTVTYVIPPGADPTLMNIPEEIVLTIGIKDTLVIENRDDKIHMFGPFVVGPHSTVVKRFKTPRVYDGVCTVHKDKYIKLVVNPAPWKFHAGYD